MKRWVDNTAVGGEAGYVDLTDEEIAEREAEEAAIANAPTPVPQWVEMRQAKLVLYATPSPTADEPDRTLLDVVDAYVSTQSRPVQIEWASATTVWRSRDLVVGIGSALGLTEEQIDQLFIAAAAIP
jgi:hypothetical protein